MGLKDTLQRMIAAHSRWNQRFSEFMAEKIDLDESIVAKNNLCEMGQWLEEGDPGVPEADRRKIRRLHADFHKIAAKVIKKKKGGDKEGAREDLDLDGSLSNASAALINKLMELYERT